MKRIFMFILVVSISITFLIFSLESNAYDKSYYMEKYRENNIELVTDKDLGELESITDGLILYLKGGENELLKPHFNNREIMHMEDVRNLFDIARLIKYIAILGVMASAFYFIRKKKLMILIKTISYGLFGNHVLLIIIGTLAYSDFNKYFTYFHLIFFSNDLWQLDPRTDLMIQMLPENFFSGMALNILVQFLILITGLQIVNYIYLRYKRSRLKHDNI